MFEHGMGKLQLKNLFWRIIKVLWCKLKMSLKTEKIKIWKILHYRPFWGFFIDNNFWDKECQIIALLKLKPWGLRAGKDRYDVIVQRHRHFSTDKRNGPQGYFLLKDIRKTESLIAENRKLCALDYIFSTFLSKKSIIIWLCFIIICSNQFFSKYVTRYLCCND